MDKNILDKLVAILKKEGKTDSANNLYSIGVGETNSVEAFNLGRDLQSIFERQLETSAMGVSEMEILGIIRGVEAVLGNKLRL